MSPKPRADDKLVARWIEPKRRAPGDPDARIAGTGIPVWALVGHYQMTGKDAAVTASDYQLPTAAVEAALAYYQLHRELIDARLAANEAVAK